MPRPAHPGVWVSGSVMTAPFPTVLVSTGADSSCRQNSSTCRPSSVAHRGQRAGYKASLDPQASARPGGRTSSGRCSRRFPGIWVRARFTAVSLLRALPRDCAKLPGQGIGRMDESPWWRASSFRWMTTHFAAAGLAVPLMVCRLARRSRSCRRRQRHGTRSAHCCDIGLVALGSTRPRSSPEWPGCWSPGR